MYGTSYKIHGTDANFKLPLRQNHASSSKSEACFGLCMESGSWDMLKLKRKAKNKIQAAVLFPVTQYLLNLHVGTSACEAEIYMLMIVQSCN